MLRNDFNQQPIMPAFADGEAAWRRVNQPLQRANAVWPGVNQPVLQRANNQEPSNWDRLSHVQVESYVAPPV